MKVMLSAPSDSPLVASFSEQGGKSVPLSLAYLGAYVSDIQGIELVGFDNNVHRLSPDAYRQLFRREAPDVLAMTVMTATLYEAWEMARVAKEVVPGLTVVVGGMHCSALPDNTMEETAFDYGVVGEGEAPFRELLLALQGGTDPSRIANLVHRQAGKVTVNPRRAPVEDLDRLPFPRRDLFEDSGYGMNVNRRSTSKKSTAILTSRGCPYECNFCSKSVYGKAFRQRSVDNVIDELALLEQEGYGEVLIVDDTFTVRRRWILEFCQRYHDRGLTIHWNCHARVNTIDEEIVRAMKGARCTGMAFGIESGNQEILERINKKITLEQARTAVDLCREHGISSLCSFIFGHPGDTHASVEDTLRTALELDSDFANFCVLVPMPGSRVFGEIQEQGLIDGFNWGRYVGHSRRPLDYSLCELTPAKLHQMQRRAFRKFYFRPRYIWRKLRALRSPGALLDQIKGAYLVALFNLQTARSGRRHSDRSGPP